MIGEHEFDPRTCDQDVHDSFGLTYASYLAVPRSLLQEMPAEWQHEFTRLMDAFNDAFPGHDAEYAVFLRGERSRFERDPLRNYRHPDGRAIEAARADRP